MNYVFGDKVCFYSSQRSKDGKPVHYNSEDPYRVGEEALIDCLLLSRTNLLVRTSSNLSLCARYFNPSIPSIEVSVRKDIGEHNKICLKQRGSSFIIK